MTFHGAKNDKDPADTRLALRLYAEYKEFFATAERTRRRKVFDDIPWDKIRKDVPEEMATVVETFCGVEAYLPDYIAGGLAVVRPYMGSMWFQANWGYEESKHALSLQEFLLRSGARTDEQMVDFQNKLWVGKKWVPPFNTGRQMTIYGAIQEQATFVFYVRQREAAKEAGHETLATIFDFIARDEIAHARFYEGVVKVLLEEDREGTLRDMALVSREFKMPAYDLVPDYDQRVMVMRELAGMDRDMFFQKVYFPVLKAIGVGRNDVVQAMIRAKKEAEASGGW